MFIQIIRENILYNIHKRIFLKCNKLESHKLTHETESNARLMKLKSSIMRLRLYIY